LGKTGKGAERRKPFKSAGRMSVAAGNKNWQEWTVSRGRGVL